MPCRKHEEQEMEAERIIAAHADIVAGEKGLAQPCKTCEGEGRLKSNVYWTGGPVSHTTVCFVCLGTGKVKKRG